jgi:hypothetical protein
MVGCEGEARAGHRLLLVYGPGKLGKGTRNCNVFVVGWFVALPFDWHHEPPVLVDLPVNCPESMGKWEVVKIEVVWEDPSVTLTNA